MDVQSILLEWFRFQVPELRFPGILEHQRRISVLQRLTRVVLLSIVEVNSAGMAILPSGPEP
jgi:hypothetical protein